MYKLQNLAYDVVVAQVSATNGATITSGQIDTRGYDEVAIIVHGTTSNAATNNPATLRVTESDDTVLTNFAAVAALVGDGASGFTIPNSPTSTTTAPFVIMHVKTGPRKRYLTVEISPLTTQTFSVIAAKGRASQAPVNTTSQNVAVAVNG